jgi:DNA-binding LytR/AlgR family response regulator
MLHAIVIEDEKTVMNDLINNLTNSWPDVTITAKLSSVKESIEYLSKSPRADIIFSDVQLADGLSFEIFNAMAVQIPVIFITGYDEFVMNTFDYNGIDYLLKPVSSGDLVKAIMKYKMLEKHFISTMEPVANLYQHLNGKKKSRLLVRKGLENILLKLEEIVFFYTENKLVYALDQNGKKYIVDKNLAELEEDLDENMFFRANRQYIININFIKGFKSFEKVKLQVELITVSPNHSIIVSQENAPAFRKWMNEA